MAKICMKSYLSLTLFFLKQANNKVIILKFCGLSLNNLSQSFTFDSWNKMMVS